MADGTDGKLKITDRRWWARGEAAEAEEVAERKPTQVEALEQRLADATAQVQHVLGEYRRAQQDFDDSRGRLRREMGREVERSRRAVLAELLEVLDNLDRTLASGRDALAHESSDAAAQVIRGVAVVRDQFLATLERFGVVRVESLGQPFDALQHDAVSLVAVGDPAQDGLVVGVVKEGYAIGDELLRVASVTVGKA